MQVITCIEQNISQRSQKYSNSQLYELYYTLIIPLMNFNI